MLDLLSLCIGMGLGIFLTVAATMLAAFLHDCREMRRIAAQPLHVNISHQWYPIPSAQTAPLSIDAQRILMHNAQARGRRNSQVLPGFDHQRLPNTEPRIQQFNPTTLQRRK